MYQFNKFMCKCHQKNISKNICNIICTNNMLSKSALPIPQNSFSSAQAKIWQVLNQFAQNKWGFIKIAVIYILTDI
jgi:hypothetical protein